MHTRRQSIWTLSIRYWLIVAGALAIAPAWVAFINRANGISDAERVGMIASLVPASIGVAVGFVLWWVLRTARTQLRLAADVAHQLGVVLIVMAVVVAIGSLVTMDGRVFLTLLAVLLLPAGVLAGTSADTRDTADVGDRSSAAR